LEGLFKDLEGLMVLLPRYDLLEELPYSDFDADSLSYKRSNPTVLN